MSGPVNPVYNQIISELILDSKSYGILKEFFGALDKYEIEYERPPKGALIKIKGHIIGASYNNIPEINFEQNKGKRINISYRSDHIEVDIFIYQKRPPIRVKIPKSWRITYSKPYLYIFFN